VLLGALVPLASIPMAIVLLTAMFTVHLPYGFSSIKLQAITAAGAQFGPPGYETDLLYLACLAALVLGGSGPLSFDRLLADPTSEAAATPNSTIWLIATCKPPSTAALPWRPALKRMCLGVQMTIKALRQAHFSGGVCEFLEQQKTRR
jgi:hypothetical protein